MSNRWIPRVLLAAVAGMSLALPALAQPKCEDPKVLKFSLVPTQDSVRELGYYKPILDQLAKNTGKKIEFYMPTSYSSVVEALMGKWVDVAVLGPGFVSEQAGKIGLPPPPKLGQHTDEIKAWLAKA